MEKSGEGVKSQGTVRVLRGLTCLAFLTGCAAVGAPIPPEDVGIAATVRKQEKEKERAAQSTLDPQETSLDPEEEIELPTFYPIGVR